MGQRRTIWILIFVSAIAIAGIQTMMGVNVDTAAETRVSTGLETEEAEKLAEQDLQASARMADAMNRTLGTALSPIFGLGVMGVVDWWKSESPEQRPWYASPIVFTPVLLILLGIALKDTLGVPLGPLKQTFDAGEVLVNKAGGSLGLIATMAYTGLHVGPEAAEMVGSAIDVLVPQAYAAEGGAEIADAGVLSSIGAFFASVFGGISYCAVWLTGHTYTIVVFLNPFTPLDPMLKAGRVGFIGGLTALTTAYPVAGLAVVLLYFAIAYYLVGFCIRLGSYGTVMAWDTLLKRGRGNTEDPKGILCFSSDGLEELPARTLGRLQKSETGVVFSYKPWLVFSEREHPVDQEDLHGICQGTIFSTIFASRPEDEQIDVVDLPPRWIGLEPQLMTKFEISESTDSALKSGIREGLTFVKSFLGIGSATSPPPTTEAGPIDE